MAAVLACGDGALLSRSPAAALHDLRTVPSGPIDVTTTARRRLAGVRAHPRPLETVHPTAVDAIPVTTIEQTIVDLAPLTATQRLRTMVENGMHRNAVDFAVLRTMCTARAGRPGTPRLEAVLGDLADVAPRVHPGLEQHALELVRAARGVDEPVANGIVEGHEVDLHWPAQRVVVELDGWAYHRDRHAFETDRRRDAALLAAGWRVLRITHEQLVAEPDRVLGELRALLQRPIGA